MEHIHKKERSLMSKKTNPIQSSIWIAEQAILLVIAVATIGATIIELVRIFDVMTVNLSDLFLLFIYAEVLGCLLYTSPSPRDWMVSRMPSSA